MTNVSLIDHHHTCPKNEPGPTPHVGGPIISGQSPCTVDGVPVAVVGDKCSCEAGGPDTIVSGSSAMTIDGQPVAWVGSDTAHGGKVVEGVAALTID